MVAEGFEDRRRGASEFQLPLGQAEAIVNLLLAEPLDQRRLCIVATCWLRMALASTVSICATKARLNLP
jgi:hypothetical protein